MSTSLRSLKPAGTREPVSGSGQVAVSERHPVTHRRHGRRDLNAPSEPAEQVAPRRGTEQSGGRSTAPVSGVAARGRHSRPAPGSPCGPCGTGERAERPLLAIEPERLSALVLPGRRSRPGARSGARPGCRRGVAGVVVCVLALGVVACSVRDAKAEASVSASASASAAIARAEKGIAEANASATASREAALTPELRAKRDAALAEPAPAKPEQMNDQTREGAAMTAWYFLELYRYAYMTGNTTELAAMSDGQCIFCKSAIDNSTKLHAEGGWKDKWEQKFSDVSFHEKVEGNKYNRVDVTASHGQIVKHPGGSAPAVTDNETKEKTLTFAMCYINGRWMVREVEVIEK